MSKIFKVDNIDEAIELANNFRKEKTYDFFRGQLNSQWKPHSSLSRIYQNNSDEFQKAVQKIQRFYNWVQSTEGLEDIAKDNDSIIAIAQHYGMATNYLDFTTDPLVAGFFAANTDKPEPRLESCIYCLDSVSLNSIWETLTKTLGNKIPILEILKPTVPNLWRLEAQSGVFIYSQTDWDTLYPMDKIIFPYTGYPSYPTKKDIYPERKSQLEILLEQFFSNEQRLLGWKKIREMLSNEEEENQKIIWGHYQPDKDEYLKYLKDDMLSEHPSWNSSKKWIPVTKEILADVLNHQKFLKIDFSLAPIEIISRIENGINRIMERDITLRNNFIHWRFELDSKEHPLRENLYKGLDLIWDGLRKLPTPDSNIATSLANWVGLYSIGFELRENKNKQQDIFESLFGDSIKVEFSTADGASSRGFVCKKALKAAIRSDINDILTDQAKLEINNLTGLLLTIRSPNLLFDFSKLAPLFISQIIPSQLVRSEPFLFSPARIVILGLP